MQAIDIDDFEELLESAENNAKNGFEMDFTSDMRDKYDEYGDTCYVSEKQLALLESIAWGENNYRRS